MSPVTRSSTHSKNTDLTHDMNHCVRAVIDRASRRLKDSFIPTYRLDAEVITAFSLGIKRIDVILDSERLLSPSQEASILRLIEDRASGTPTAYITGTKEFWSLTLSVDKRVLIPRPETELLVEQAAACLANCSDKIQNILEIGTGSGAVSLALCVELSCANIVATDKEPGALAVAAINITAHNLTDRIRLVPGDLYEPLRQGEIFSAIVSNPPYLTATELGSASMEVRREPQSALLGGEDGLSIIRGLVCGAPKHLAPGGYLIFEIGANQGDAVRSIIDGVPGLSFSHISRDLSGHLRVAVAQKTAQ